MTDSMTADEVLEQMAKIGMDDKRKTELAEQFIKLGVTERDAKEIVDLSFFATANAFVATVDAIDRVSKSASNNSIGNSVLSTSIQLTSYLVTFIAEGIVQNQIEDGGIHSVKRFEFGV